MNFKELYDNASRRTVEAVTAMWGKGNPSLQNYLTGLLTDKEPLFAEPVFQSTFPWKPGQKTLGECTDLFAPEFIKAIGDAKEYSFESSIKPYTHQLKSWNTLLKDKKSIVVTSGTGSGKTECFMLPVLQDLYDQNDTEGVQALFLYPLNALMGSQRKRMRNWVSSINKNGNKAELRFAQYNGKMPEDSNIQDLKNAHPEVPSRRQMRDNPPQILFTNPTMLEYMLVRKKDQPILEKSQGKLRWILLDEAHTFSGSTAAEMALLIRRIVDAFGVDIKDVRFAATSATIGGENAESGLKEFLAGLSNKSIDDIEVIGGTRVKEIEPPAEYDTPNFLSLKKLSVEDRIKSKQIQDLRKEFLIKDVLSTEEISKRFEIKSIDEQLELVQLLGEPWNQENDVLVPLRGHYFQRTLPGLFGCSNADCKGDEHRNNAKFPFTLSTKWNSQCPECGYPMLEVVSCNTCGQLFLSGESNGHLIRMKLKEADDLLELDDDDDENLESTLSVSDKLLIFNKLLKGSVPDNSFPCKISKEGIIQPGTELIEISPDNQNCPACTEAIRFPHHFGLSGEFLSRQITPTLLEQMPKAEKETGDTTFHGKKLIAFTDSRQGTARSSALLNNEVERNWIRSNVYHILARARMANTHAQNSSDNEEVLRQKLDGLKAQPSEFQALFINEIKELEKSLESLSGGTPDPVQISWTDLKQKLITIDGKLPKLVDHIKRKTSATIQSDDYVHSLLLDQFCYRPRTGNTPENMGFVSIQYPKLNTAVLSEPKSFTSKDEWKEFLKICIDYVIRQGRHFVILDRAFPLQLINLGGRKRLFPSSSPIGGVKKWPVCDRNHVRQNRLTTLLCAGLGWNEIDATREDTINQILTAAWQQLVACGILEGSPSDGFLLDLEKSASFEVATKGSLCPVTNSFLDVQFRGVSPWIKGAITKENYDRFKIVDSNIEIPFFPYAQKMDFSANEIPDDTIMDWIVSEWGELRNKGIWSDIHERILLKLPIFLAGEHSAQQNDKKLRKLEEMFEENRLNLLSCSTTMEMGVDIGGISGVLMNTVPPKPANYLQRAGRAGRRKESRSVAYTLCSATPIGEQVLAEPKWAMTHEIAMPKVKLNSRQILQRHINSMLFGVFIREQKGLKVTEKVSAFFEKVGENSVIDEFVKWLATNVEETVQRSITTIKENTDFESMSYLSFLDTTVSTISQIEQIYLLTVEKLSNEMKQAEPESLKARALFRELSRVQNNNLLKFLVERGFLPGAGIPVGVVEFNNESIADFSKKDEPNEKNEDNAYRTVHDVPSHHITRALNEYAPGKTVVIDGWAYKSSGITLSSTFSVTSINKVRQCTSCGHQYLVGSEGQVYKTGCPVCGSGNSESLTDETTETELIEPAGFAVSIYDEPSRKIEKNKFVPIVDPLLLGMTPWSNQTGGLYDYRTGKENAEILHYNRGQGYGFAVCLKCGTTVPELCVASESESSPLLSHNKLRGGNEKNIDRSIHCDGGGTERRNVILGGRIQTEICEIRLKNFGESGYSRDKVLLRSFGTALKNAIIQELGIEAGEIEIGIRNNRLDNSQFFSIFIYDTAQGGAGYSMQVISLMDRLLEKMYTTVSKCTCPKACQSCLVDRDSQWHLDDLDRLVLLQWLDDAKVWDEQLPQEISNLALKRIPDSLVNSLRAHLYRDGIKELTVYAQGDFENWTLEDSELTRFIKDCNLKGANTTLAIYNYRPMKNSIDEVMLQSQIKSFSKVTLLQELPVYGSFLPLVEGKSLNGNTFVLGTLYNSDISLFSDNSDAELSVFKGLRVQRSHQLEYAELPVPTLTPQTTMAEVYVEFTKSTISLFGKKIFDECSQKLPQISDMVQGKDVSICYSDRYLHSPFGALLLVEIVDHLKKIGANINSIAVQIGQCRRDNTGVNFNELTANWYSEEKKIEFLEALLEKRIGISADISISNPKELDHFRWLEIDTGDNVITIRPDGGVENGWKCLFTRWNFKQTLPVKDLVEGYELNKSTINITKWNDKDNILYTLVVE